ncbi:MAG TPA: hypothetical protein VKG23_00695 [Thermoanaerobaculia bacterium]|nr:hypothetical protein [Thermoanaerobaculia bacterium]
MPSARRFRSAVWTAAVLFAAAASARAQTVPVDVVLGYRFVDVSGNENEYRTQINDRPGVLLRSLDYTAPGSIGFLDTLQITGSDIGAGPAGQFRLLAAQTDVFRLNFSWRETDLFSALPAFANPFLDQGIIPGQQTWNRTRNIYDVQLDLLPGKIVSPILGYTRNVYDGPGTTTYHLGENEFLLDQQVQSVDQLYRIGLDFNWNDIHAGFTQGWRQYTWEDVATLAPGAGSGNVTAPFLGQTQTAQAITQTEHDKVNTPVTNAWLTASFFGRLKIIGTFIKADASDETNFVEADLGQFLSFELARFFSGLAEDVSSKARTDYWKASGQAEISLTSNVQVLGGWAENSRALDGTALISSLYVDTVTYAGQSTGNLLREINAHTEVDEMDRTYNAGVTARQLGPFSVNAGWSQTQQNVTATPDASEIVIPGGQGGRYERRVNTYGGGATFSQWGLTLTANYHHDAADAPIFRTDYISRDRYDFRGLWNFNNVLKVGAVFRETQADDDIVTIGYSTTIREVQGNFEVTLLKDMLTIRGAGGEFLTDRDILIRQPQDFSIVTTQQRELGHNWEGGVHFVWQSLSLDAAYLWMNNNGSIPFTVDRIRVLAEYFFTKNLGLDFEWMRDKYDERVAFDQAGPLADFNGNRYFVGVHWRP